MFEYSHSLIFAIETNLFPNRIQFAVELALELLQLFTKISYDCRCNFSFVFRFRFAPIDCEIDGSSQDCPAGKVCVCHLSYVACVVCSRAHYDRSKLRSFSMSEGMSARSERERSRSSVCRNYVFVYVLPFLFIRLSVLVR